MNKTYRPALADSYAHNDLLCYAAECADIFTRSANAYFSMASENPTENGDPDPCNFSQAKEYEAKAAAFERLIDKLSK